MCTLLRPLTCKLIGTMSGTAYPFKYLFLLIYLLIPCTGHSMEHIARQIFVE